MDNCGNVHHLDLFSGPFGLHFDNIFEKVGKVKMVLALERQHHFKGFRRRYQLQPDLRMASQDM